MTNKFPNMTENNGRQLPNPIDLNPSISVNGARLFVVGLADPDYTYHLTLKELPGGGVEFDDGFDLDVLHLLEYSLNFTHIALKGEGWIDLNPDGSWGGVGRQITSKEANLSIAQSTFLAERVGAFSYLVPTMWGELAASFKQPSGAAVRNLLTESFPGDLWLGLLLAGFLVLAMIKIVWGISSRFQALQIVTEVEIVEGSGADIQGESEDKIDEEAILVHEAFFWILVSFCQKSLIGTPQSTPMRIIYISLVITTLVGYTAFSAALVSKLAVELLPIRSFTDLVDSELQVYGDIAIPYTHGYVQTILKKRGSTYLTENVSASDHFLDVHQGIRRLMGGGIYITFKDAMTSVEKATGLSDKYICSNIYQFKIPGSFFPGGMVVAKGSELREVFNPKLIQMIQTGLLRRVTNKWHSAVFPKCLQNLKYTERSSRDSLTLSDVYTAFVILIFGQISGVVLYCLEKLVAFLTLFNLISNFDLAGKFQKC